MKTVIVLMALVSRHCFVAKELPEPVTSCEHKGETYAIGESVPYDSCNTCNCGPYGMMCTLRACPEHLDGCFVHGKWYYSGTNIPAPDGCNTCLCENGENVSCTKMACI